VYSLKLFVVFLLANVIILVHRVSKRHTEIGQNFANS